MLWRCYQFATGDSVTALNIRNLPDEVHRALKARAKVHERSMEAEVRTILEDVLRPPVGLGSMLAAIGREFGGVDLLTRDPTPTEPAIFE